MQFVKVKCSYCGKEVKKSLGHYNRSLRTTTNFYCNIQCAGKGKRTSIEDKKAKKAAYDKKIAATPERKQKRKEYFQKSYINNPEKYRAIRKQRYKKHLEYLSSPKYIQWKHEYDQKYRAKKEYGVFWECSLILKELENFLLINRPDGIKFQMGITNKTQKRKRLCQRTIKQQKNLLQPI